MRCALAIAAVLFAAVAQGADDTPKASGTLNGKGVQFPEKSVTDGVKAAVGLLESCHSESLYQDEEFKKALQGDHIQLVFAKPYPARVNNEQIEFSELVFQLPRNTGVFWVRIGASGGDTANTNPRRRRRSRLGSGRRDWRTDAEPDGVLSRIPISSPTRGQKEAGS